MEERSPGRRRIFEEMGGVEFVTEFFKFFGPRRAMQLVGWAVLWGVKGVEIGPEFREKLKAQGISQATAYRASLDFRRFKDFVEYRVGRPVTWAEIMAELRSADGDDILSAENAKTVV